MSGAAASASTPAEDLDLVCDVARAAGRVALDRRARGLDVRRKTDGSPVSDGDLEVNALLSEALLAARPDYGWLSEETPDDPTRLAAARLFIVDPIDGTSAYIRNKPWFAISVAVVEAGLPVAGVVFAPALDEVYTASLGGGARCNGALIEASAADRLEDCAMLASATAFEPRRWPEPWPPMRVGQRTALAYRMALVAAGRFDAAVSLGWKHDWDIAAGDLIAREAGAATCDQSGRPLTFNSARAQSAGLICAAAALTPLILRRTAPIDLPVGA